MKVVENKLRVRGSEVLETKPPIRTSKCAATHSLVRDGKGSRLSLRPSSVYEEAER